MKYLLGNEICGHCGGFGVFRTTHPDFRVRLKFPNDIWEFLDQTFDSIDAAEWTAVEMKTENIDIEYEVITPSGEIISV